MTANKVYVGNLPYSITSGSLEELFKPYGDVISASVVTDRATGRSRGFGFVEMSADEQASQAIAELNGKNIDGRDLICNIARPKESNGGGGGGQRNSGRPDRDRNRNRY
jgi:RNA recognition motif-containing protein